MKSMRGRVKSKTYRKVEKQGSTQNGFQQNQTRGSDSLREKGTKATNINQSQAATKAQHFLKKISIVT